MDFLEEFLVGIVTDTAANMTSAGRLYHCPLHYCVAHNLELTTKLAFNVLGGNGVMKACRALVRHFKLSSQATAKLLAKQPSGTAVGVVQDVVTRWWST